MANKNRFVLGILLGLVAIAIFYTINGSRNDSSSENQANHKGAVEHLQSNVMVNVIVPELSGAEKSGEAKFLQFCATCHGVAGSGTKGLAPPLIHKIYEPNHHGDIAFYYAAERGVKSHHWPFGNMQPVKGIKKSDVRDIILYIRAVQRENGIN